VNGKTSWLGLKSYDQKRKAFEGTEKEVVWMDEEPPADVYTECLTRTATVNGIVFCTFTPLEGATEIVQSFLQPEVDRR
jgi:phage terminase large subunit-like protein